jgi:hypothetical protein
MAEETNWLLTDEFIAFSDKIRVIHEKKKVKKQEIKDFYKKIETEIKALDIEAKKLEDEFQTWKKSAEKSAKE